jgi:hypothetical protein
MLTLDDKKYKKINFVSFKRNNEIKMKNTLNYLFKLYKNV